MLTTYVLDTCIFNKLVDKKLQFSQLPINAHFVATHIQLNELNADSDVEHRNELLKMFNEINPTQLITESAVWDVSEWGNAKLGNGEVQQQITNKLNQLNKNKANNVKDALTAEVAIINNFVLITSDFHLANVAKEMGCSVKHFEV